MTVTTAERTYPTVWVIGDYCGWNHGKSQFLFSFSGDEITYEAIVDFGEKAANGFKLTASQAGTTRATGAPTAMPRPPIPKQPPSR